MKRVSICDEFIELNIKRAKKMCVYERHIIEFLFVALQRLSLSHTVATVKSQPIKQVSLNSEPLQFSAILDTCHTPCSTNIMSWCLNTPYKQYKVSSRKIKE